MIRSTVMTAALLVATALIAAPVHSAQATTAQAVESSDGKPCPPSRKCPTALPKPPPTPQT